MLEELKKSCAAKATAWDARREQRNKELVALQDLQVSFRRGPWPSWPVSHPGGHVNVVVSVRFGGILQETIKILDSDKSLDLFRGSSFIQTSADEDVGGAIGMGIAWP